LSAFFPASVDATVPIQTAAKTSALESADEDFEVFAGQEIAVRPVGQTIQDAATCRTENSRKSVLVELS
jgi:hypothetical protein